MFSSRFILILARVLLLLGSLSLISASIRLFHRALEAGLPVWHLYYIIPVSILAGAFKARVVMRKRMIQNIQRLKTSQGKLWLWDIYPRPLLLFIFSMITSMIVLKQLLAGNAVGLVALGGVDAAVAVALFMASLEYRRKNL
ncbi:MAG: hypothetical protein GY780_00510 [bacterium]|nr:hypothetical protein [bacterium]